MRWKVSFALLIASGAPALLARAGPPETRPETGAVKVTVTQVEDERILVRVPLSDRIRGGLSPHLGVDLMLQGDGVRNASRTSAVVLVEAVDDLGNSLIRSDAEFAEALAHPVDHRGNQLMSKTIDYGMPETRPSEELRAIRWASDNDEAEAIVRPGISLKSPIRRATKIARIRGSVRIMAGGQRTTVDIPNLPALIGHAINHPVLKQAGLRIKLTTEGNEAADHSKSALTTFNLEVTGDMAQIRKVRVFEGKDDVTAWNPNVGDNTWSISLHQPLTQTMVMRLDVVYGQKLIKIPVELNDVPLP